MGVGHFAKEAEKMAFSNGDVVAALLEANEQYDSASQIAANGPKKSVEVLMGKEARRVYDTPRKGILWGWEVSGYVVTKAIAAGAFIVPSLAAIFGWGQVSVSTEWQGIGIALLFLLATGILLVMDLDQPKRFLYVLLRPHWSSWLVKGGYAITVYGGLLTALAVAMFFRWDVLQFVFAVSALLTAVLVAIYTAFLFAQAKGRDFWQSPNLAFHMLVHSLMAGAAVFLLLDLFTETSASWTSYLTYMLYGSIGFNLFALWLEVNITHPTEDAKRTVKMITKGRYARLFYWGVIFMGNLLPVGLLLVGGEQTVILAIAGALVIAGIYITEHIWVEAPQRIPLT